MEPKKRSFLASQKAKGGCSSDANDKMNQAWGNNDCDINNDNVWWALAGKHKALFMQSVFLRTRGEFIYLFFLKAVCIDISLTKRHQTLTARVCCRGWRCDRTIFASPFFWKQASWQNPFSSSGVFHLMQTLTSQKQGFSVPNPLRHRAVLFFYSDKTA